MKRFTFSVLALVISSLLGPFAHAADDLNTFKTELWTRTQALSSVLSEALAAPDPRELADAIETLKETQEYKRCTGALHLKKTRIAACLAYGRMLQALSQTSGQEEVAKLNERTQAAELALDSYIASVPEDRRKELGAQIEMAVESAYSQAYSDLSVLIDQETRNIAASCNLRSLRKSMICGTQSTLQMLRTAVPVQMKSAADSFGSRMVDVQVAINAFQD